MPVILIASAEPRVGRSTIAAAIAARLARDGARVSLARLGVDDASRADAAAFARIATVPSPDAPVAPADIASSADTIVAEAPAGDVRPLLSQLTGARVVVVGGVSSPTLTVPGDALAGSVVTRASASDIRVVAGRAGVLAVLPEDRQLAAPSVADIVAALQARSLVDADGPGAIGRVMIGTVASDAASPYFDDHESTCVVTRFDKTDIQLAALNTDLRCLVLTGGGDPSPYLLDRVAGGRDPVTVLLAEGSTVDAMRTIEGLYGRSPFAGQAKLDRAVELLDAAGFSLAL